MKRNRTVWQGCLVGPETDDILGSLRERIQNYEYKIHRLSGWGLCKRQGQHSGCSGSLNEWIEWTNLCTLPALEPCGTARWQYSTRCGKLTDTRSVLSLNRMCLRLHFKLHPVRCNCSWYCFGKPTWLPLPKLWSITGTCERGQCMLRNCNATWFAP